MANDADDALDSDEGIIRRLCDTGFERDEHGHYGASGCSVWIYRHHKGDWRIDIRVGNQYLGCRVAAGGVWSRKSASDG